MTPLPESPTSVLVSPPKKQTLDLFSVFKNNGNHTKGLGFSSYNHSVFVGVSVS